MNMHMIAAIVNFWLVLVLYIKPVATIKTLSRNGETWCTSSITLCSIWAIFVFVLTSHFWTLLVDKFSKSWCTYWRTFFCTNLLISFCFSMLVMNVVTVLDSESKLFSCSNVVVHSVNKVLVIFVIYFLQKISFVSDEIDCVNIKIYSMNKLFKFVSMKKLLYMCYI